MTRCILIENINSSLSEQSEAVRLLSSHDAQCVQFESFSLLQNHVATRSQGVFAEFLCALQQVFSTDAQREHQQSKTLLLDLPKQIVTEFAFIKPSADSELEFYSKLKGVLKSLSKLSCYADQNALFSDTLRMFLIREDGIRKSTTLQEFLIICSKFVCSDLTDSQSSIIFDCPEKWDLLLDESVLASDVSSLLTPSASRRLRI